MKIENYGVGERCREVMRLLTEWASIEETNAPGRIILLPIPTSRDGIHLCGSDKLLHEVVSEVDYGDLVVGYSIPSCDTEYIRSRGAFVFDAAADELFLEENAYLTALGTLEYLLSEHRCVPSDMHVGIIGYGRIGSALLRILLFLGAKIRIYTSKNLTRVELGENGVESRYIDYANPTLGDTADLDVLINTAPTRLGSCFDGGVPCGIRVIELASGDNFAGVEGVVRLPSIPEKNYPKSAGRAYFHAIQRYMREVF